MSGLGERQQRLVDAVLGRPGAGVDGLASVGTIGIERGLDAYRLNARALAARALGSVFPRLRDWLGADDFDAMAWAFWRSAPPRQGDLALWGGGLAGFLAAQPGIEPAPLDLARLEWAIHQAERAADAPLPDAASLQRLADTEPARLQLLLRPGLTLLPQSDGPWLVWRRHWRAESRAVSLGDAALIAALLAGRSLGQALDTAALADPEHDFAAWLQAALGEGWLLAVRLRDDTDDQED
ncbi:putative DNA-binding domain-containing protein [Pelomonas sp. KK5]|uniref:HvfC/BufC family peptide modification chaperone n=1 Tax=Pelomonas sp. KK5 TaxID=1855730 RepID=UPI00097BC2B8|nr:putative DNA-binding domain-containing protein [Pelomonas sp. KK5]